MEKIYMDSGKEQKKESFLKKLFNDKGSMTAIIVVAVVGIVSLMVFGFNQISYAAEVETTTNEVTFVSEQVDDEIIGAAFAPGGTSCPDSNIGFNSFGKKDNSDYVICIDYMTDYIDGKTYKNGDLVNDAGLIYLLNELDRVFAQNNTPADLSYWLKQTAVWAYLYEPTQEANYIAKDATKAERYKVLYENIGNVYKLYKSTSGVDDPPLHEVTSGYSFWDQYGIKAIYDTARSMKGTAAYNYSLNITRENDRMTMTSDGKYYISSLYSVVSTGAGHVDNYTVDFSDAPAGTVLVDASGEMYNNYVSSEKNMVLIDSGSKQFKLKIPANKVTDENKSFDIGVSGNLKGTGYVEYHSEGYQSVIDTGPVSKMASDIEKVEINYTPTVPNTAMGVAETIYFIGLILLLSGVGIVYANAKPKTSE